VQSRKVDGALLAALLVLAIVGVITLFGDGLRALLFEPQAPVVTGAARESASPASPDGGAKGAR
jgi:hypothetical protein